VGRNQADRDTWSTLIRAGGDSQVLDALDQDAPALVAYVRANSDEARRAAEEAQKMDEELL